MDQRKRFNLIVKLFEDCNEILNKKGLVYGNEQDSMASFKEIADITGLTVFQVWQVNFLTKLVLILKAIEKDNKNPQIDEKEIKHAINFLALLVPLLKDDKEKKN